jgi:hypothetical protein
MEAPANTHRPLPGFSHRSPRFWRLVAIIILIYVGILAGKVAYDLRHRTTVAICPPPAAQTGPGEGEKPPSGTKEFSSANHPRALGLKFRLNYPQDWKQEAMEGPRSLATFFSDQGKGRESMVLFVVPDPPRSPIVSEKFRKELFSGILAGYRCKYCVVSSRHMKLAGQEGLAVSFDDFKNNAHMKVINYLLPVGHKMITIQCRVESLKKDEELDTRFKSCMPLFDRIAQSLTLN